jgi:hypothetical protein
MPIQNRRPALADGTGVNLRSVLNFARAAQKALEQEGEEDSALRFELLADYLEKDVANGKPFGFTYKTIGL